MKRSRISCLLGICFIFSALFLPGCGKTPASLLDPQHPVTLSLWHYYAGENQVALEQAISAFNQGIGLERGVVVEAVGMPDIPTLEARVEASARGAINSGPLPDLFSSYPDVAYTIDQLDKLVDLRDYFTVEELARYVPEFLEDGSFREGRLLILPVVKSTELLYVNETAWREFADANGLDDTSLATWESLYSTARLYYHWTDAQTPDIPWDGTAFTGLDSVSNFIVIANRQMGVEIIHPDPGGSGYALLDRDALQRLFEFYYRGHSLGYLGAFGKFRSDDLKQNDLISYVGSSSGASYFPAVVLEENTPVPIDLLPLHLPVFEHGDPYVTQQGAGMCMTRSTPPKQEAAALFLKWFTDPPQNISFAATTGYLPVTQEALGAQEFFDTLERLSIGSKRERIISGVYGKALEQVTQRVPYSAPPFDNSYRIRIILQDTLSEIGEAGIALAAPLKQQGLPEQEILVYLDVFSKFENWIKTVKQQLNREGIPYIEQ